MEKLVRLCKQHPDGSKELKTKLSLFKASIQIIALLTLVACTTHSTPSRTRQASSVSSKPWATEAQIQETALRWKSTGSIEDITWLCETAWRLKMSKQKVETVIGKPLKTASGRDAVGQFVEQWYYYTHSSGSSSKKELGINFGSNGIAIGNFGNVSVPH